ncbi:myrosinase 1-like [Thrips palmi]|uniref:Myrosinase 1-like n=1 Tax=Thrips palmi TaxID=161013 RepID=A0A6P8Y3B1_THRPL|nr:myrosinase 1-like [Thrips palmi]
MSPMLIAPKGGAKTAQTMYAEAVCAPAVCNSSTLLVYQRWPGGASVFFLCVDERPEHAYVADCGADSAISPDGVCSLACLREGRLPDASRPQGYFECVRTAGGFGSPVPATCPPGTAFHAASQRCVGAATNDDDGDHPEEDLYAPSASESESLYMLPAFYRIGVASAAHQIEGAWSEEWRSATVWNVGDVAHDVQLLKELGVNMYRFPLAWSRLLPRGSQEEGYDAEALDYYNNLIDELIANNIEPVVTIHHRDIPQMYLDDGGWFTEAIQDRFVDFADLAFMSFGDRVSSCTKLKRGRPAQVKMWVLLDSPQAHCMEAYEGVESAPGLGLEGTGGYGCVHNMILAHAMAYHLYNNTYKMIQGGKVGSALDLQFQMPASNSREDAEAAERANVFTFAWFADPVMVGDYPAAMRDVVDRNSFGNGLAASRLPVFTAAEKALISGTMDFIGLNHYTTSLTRPGTAAGLVASIYNDTNAVSHSRASWLRTARDGFVVAPWGFRAALNWIKDRFNNFPVLVTANGYFGRRDEECHDPDREGYHSVYMRALARAVNEDACNVVGYMAWSLKDGYNLKTGLAYVNLSDPERPGTLKQSARFIQDVTRTMYARYVQPV